MTFTTGYKVDTILVDRWRFCWTWPLCSGTSWYDERLFKIWG